MKRLYFHDLPVGWGYMAVESDARSAVEIYGLVVKTICSRYKGREDWLERVRAETQPDHLRSIFLEASRRVRRSRDEHPERNDTRGFRKFFPETYAPRVWDGNKWRVTDASEESGR